MTMQEMLDLLAAWKKPGGPTPDQPKPNTYKTVTEARALLDEAERVVEQAVLDLHEAAGRFATINEVDPQGCSELTREAAHRADAFLTKLRKEKG